MSGEFNRKWDLGKLDLFASVAELGSLTKVAAVRSSSQPAISRQIASLERELGGRLFARTGRGVALSELGQRVLPRIRAILAQAEQLSEEIGTTAGVPTGEVRVGALPSLHKMLIGKLFRAALERYPKVRLHIFEGSGGQIDEWLATGYIDIGLPYRYGKHLPSNAHPLIVADSYLVGAAGDRLTKFATVDFEQLDRKPLVLPGAPSSVRGMLDQLARRKHIVLNVVLAADSLQIQKDVVLEGGGYTVLPRHAVLGEIEAGTLQASRIVKPGIKRTVMLVTTVARPLSLASREIAKLIRQLAEVAR